VTSAGVVEPFAGAASGGTNLDTTVYPADARTVAIGDIAANLAYGMVLDEPRNRLFYSSSCGVFVIDTTTHVMNRFLGLAGGCGDSGQGGPAIDGRIGDVRGLAVTDTGRVWVASDRAVHVVDTVGRFDTVARALQNDGTVRLGNFMGPLGSIPGSEDVLMFADLDFGGLGRSCVTRITTGARFTRLAGGGSDRMSDGIAAVSAQIDGVSEGFGASDGSIVFCERGYARVRRVATDGTISTVAGTLSTPGDVGEGVPASASTLVSPAVCARWRDTHIVFWQQPGAGDRSIRAIW
jgi:hypothetical protein